MLLSRLIATGVAGAGGATVFGFSYSSEKKRQESQINGGNGWFCHRRSTRAQYWTPNSEDVPF